MRPHAELIALADDDAARSRAAPIRCSAAGRSASDSRAAHDDSPTPITRIALPVALPASPLRWSSTATTSITLDPQRCRGLGRRQPAAAEGAAAAQCLGRRAGRGAPPRRRRCPCSAKPGATLRAPGAASRAVAAPPLLADATPKRVAGRVEPDRGAGVDARTWRRQPPAKTATHRPKASAHEPRAERRVGAERGHRRRRCGRAAERWRPRRRASIRAGDGRRIAFARRRSGGDAAEPAQVARRDRERPSRGEVAEPAARRTPRLSARAGSLRRRRRLRRSWPPRRRHATASR